MSWWPYCPITDSTLSTENLWPSKLFPITNPLSEGIILVSSEYLVHCFGSGGWGVHGDWANPVWTVSWWQLVYSSLAVLEPSPIHRPWTMTKWPSHSPLISTAKTTGSHPKTDRCDTLATTATLMRNPTCVRSLTDMRRVRCTCTYITIRIWKYQHTQSLIDFVLYHLKNVAFDFSVLLSSDRIWLPDLSLLIVSPKSHS